MDEAFHGSSRLLEWEDMRDYPLHRILWGIDDLYSPLHFCRLAKPAVRVHLVHRGAGYQHHEIPISAQQMRRLAEIQGDAAGALHRNKFFRRSLTHRVPWGNLCAVLSPAWPLIDI